MKYCEFARGKTGRELWEMLKKQPESRRGLLIPTDFLVHQSNCASASVP